MKQHSFSNVWFLTLTKTIDQDLNVKLTHQTSVKCFCLFLIFQYMFFDYKIIYVKFKTWIPLSETFKGSLHCIYHLPTTVPKRFVRGSEDSDETPFSSNLCLSPTDSGVLVRGSQRLVRNQVSFVDFIPSQPKKNFMS